MLPKIVARPWQVPLFRIFYRFITLLQYETDYRWNSLFFKKSISKYKSCESFYDKRTTFYTIVTNVSPTMSYWKTVKSFYMKTLLNGWVTYTSGYFPNAHILTLISSIRNTWLSIILENRDSTTYMPLWKCQRILEIDRNQPLWGEHTWSTVFHVLNSIPSSDSGNVGG